MQGEWNASFFSSTCFPWTYKENFFSKTKILTSLHWKRKVQFPHIRFTQFTNERIILTRQKTDWQWKLTKKIFFYNNNQQHKNLLSTSLFRIKCVYVHRTHEKRMEEIRTDQVKIRDWTGKMFIERERSGWKWNGEGEKNGFHFGVSFRNGMRVQWTNEFIMWSKVLKQVMVVCLMCTLLPSEPKPLGRNWETFHCVTHNGVLSFVFFYFHLFRRLRALRTGDYGRE